MYSSSYLLLEVGGSLRRNLTIAHKCFLLDGFLMVLMPYFQMPMAAFLKQLILVSESGEIGKDICKECQPIFSASKFIIQSLFC
jgi:hypothetical protein